MKNSTGAPDRNLARILVVDDDDIARRSITEILRLEGYIVEQTGNAAEAVEILQQQAFDIVLLDLRMPIENRPQNAAITEEQAGMIVLRFVAKEIPDTPVIILTAHASLETAIEALRYKAEDYLLKPATPEKILSTLDGALKRRKEVSRQRSEASALQQAKSIAVELTQSIGKLESTLQALQQVGGDSADTTIDQAEDSRLPLETINSILLNKNITFFEQRDGIIFDLERREIRQLVQNHQGTEPSLLRISLTPTEGKLIKTFLNNPGKVFSHQELVAQVQGYDTSEQEAPDVLRPLVSRLRRKLEIFPNGRTWIRSIRGTGYVFDISMKEEINRVSPH
jgi:DNA-binding response OmpR family regulator